MHSATVVFALACVAAANAGLVAPVAVHVPVAPVEIYARPSYSFSYAVADKLTGDQKSATETRDGDLTKGSYSLVQPDGVLRTVNYISTPHGGFQAQVINSGHAAHPGFVHHAPVVVAPVAVAPVHHGHGHGPHH